MKVAGFKKVDYSALQVEMKKVSQRELIPEVQLASQIKVKSVQTIKNALMSDEQSVSDEVLLRYGS